MYVLYVYACMYIHMCGCLYMCMCTYICIHVYIIYKYVYALYSDVRMCIHQCYVKCAVYMYCLSIEANTR